MAVSDQSAKGRAFLVVLDSVGIGGAPDADQYFNGDLPDTGSNTFGHIAQACAWLLYTSDAADDLLSADPAGRRLI